MSGSLARDCQVPHRERGHLPLFAVNPVALDPRTHQRARVGLAIKCVCCGNRYRVHRNPWGLGDLEWRRTYFAPFALSYDPAVYFAGPANHDWSTGKPTGPDGLWIWQYQVTPVPPDAERCESTHETGHGRIGQDTTWYTSRCVLWSGHAGVHESPDPNFGAVGWGGGTRG